MSAKVTNGEWVKGPGGVRTWRPFDVEEQSLTERVVLGIRGQLSRSEVRLVDVADSLGMSPETLRRRLKGETQITLAELEAFGRALGVSPLSLLGVKEHSGPAYVVLGAIDSGGGDINISITLPADGEAEGAAQVLPAVARIGSVANS